MMADLVWTKPSCSKCHYAIGKHWEYIAWPTRAFGPEMVEAASGMPWMLEVTSRVSDKPRRKTTYHRRLMDAKADAQEYENRTTKK